MVQAQKNIEKVIKDIKSLKVQGNTNIAKVAVRAILDYITYGKFDSFSEFTNKVKYYCNELANARPNEPLTYNAMAFIISDVESSETPQQARVKVIDRIQSFFSYVDESFEIIKENAFQLLKGYRVFMTHCHSSLVTDVLIRIAEVNPDIHVITTETRPMYQGRTTTLKLASSGIRVTHIVDSATSSFILDSRYHNPEVILVGSDGITVKGDLINKVGTLNISLAARAARIPLYVVSQSMKIDLRSSELESFEIEIRDPAEIWDIQNKNVNIVNPAFDLVPARYITAYITEKGILTPKDFAKLI